jgi:hypothetical protein
MWLAGIGVATFGTLYLNLAGSLPLLRPAAQARPGGCRQHGEAAARQ